MQRARNAINPRTCDVTTHNADRPIQGSNMPAPIRYRRKTDCSDGRSTRNSRIDTITSANIRQLNTIQPSAARTARARSVAVRSLTVRGLMFARRHFMSAFCRLDLSAGLFVRGGVKIVGHPRTPARHGMQGTRCQRCRPRRPYQPNRRRPHRLHHGIP